MDLEQRINVAEQQYFVFGLEAEAVALNTQWQLVVLS